MAGRGSSRKKSAYKQNLLEIDLKEIEKQLAAQEIPKGISEVFIKLSQVVNTLQRNVNNMHNPGGKSSDTDIIARIQECVSAVTADSDFKMKLLTNIVIRQEEKIKDLEGKIENAKLKEARPNIVVSGLIEVEGKTHKHRLNLVKEFFSQQMEIEQKISLKDAYRRGCKEHKNRPIVAVLKSIEDKAVIFENVSNLKGKENARRQLFFVEDDMNEQQTKTCRHF